MKDIKKYYCDDGIKVSTIYIGSARDIASMHKAICRAGEKGNTSYFPLFVEPPKFNPAKVYGLNIEEDGSFTIIAAEVIAMLLVDDCLIKA